MSKSHDVRICVFAELRPSFIGEPPHLLAPFADSTVLRTTVKRLLAADLASVTVIVPDLQQNRAVEEALRELPVTIHRVEGGTSEPAALLEVCGEGAVLRVDPAAVFVSHAVLRALLEAHQASPRSMTTCPLVPSGLTGVVFESEALAQLAAALGRAMHGDPSLTFGAFIEQARSFFHVNEIEPPPGTVCIPATLLPRTRAEVDRLSAFALDGLEDYGPVFTAEATLAWSPRVVRRAARARPRVLFTNYTNGREQGATRAFEILLEGLRTDLYEPVVALPARGELYKHLHGKYEVHEAPHDWFSSADGTIPRWPAMIGAATDVLKTARPDVVFASGAMPAFGIAARLAEVPSICHMHLPILSMASWISKVLSSRSLLWHFDLCVATSRWTELAIAEAFRPPPGRLRKVAYGIPFAELEEDRVPREEARARLGLPANRRVVVQVGTLAPIKNCMLAVEVLPSVVRAHADVLLVFAGQERGAPGMRESLEKRAAELGVQDHVAFIGQRRDIGTVYSAAEILLHCGIRETFGMVMVEAGYFELPVVAIDLRGPSEIIVDGVTGRLVPAPGHSDAVAAALNEVLDDPARAAAMGRAAREHVMQFDVSHYLDHMHALFDELTAGR